MHVLGKVFAWLVVIGCGVAVVFTAQTLAVRDHYMKKLCAAEKEVAKNDALLEEKRAALHRVDGELVRASEPWGRYWNNVRAAGNGKGELAVEVGSQKGMAEKQVVYVFVEKEGGPVYLGDYRVTAARDDQARLEPNFRARPGDADINGEVTVRIRSHVPGSVQKQLTELEHQLLVVDELTVTDRRELTRQNALLKSAEEHLAFRLQQVNGHPETKGKTVPREISQGLLTVLAEEEEQRNAALIQVDQLLRQLKDVRTRLKETLAENRKLVQRLPRLPTTPAPSKVTRR